MLRASGILIFFALNIASAYADGPAARHWNFKVDLWSADCQPGAAGVVPGPLHCGLPTRAFDTLTIQVDTPSLGQPGAVSPASQDFDVTTAKGIFRGRVTVFAVFPHKSAQLPPYDQVRLELWAPARINCNQSVRRQDPPQHPPLLCSGYSSDGTLQAGANLLLEGTSP